MSLEMEDSKNVQMTDVQKLIFQKIAKNDVGDLKDLLIDYKECVDFFDDNGMTPLQHACYKGNKEIVQVFLDLVSIQMRFLKLL